MLLHNNCINCILIAHLLHISDVFPHPFPLVGEGRVRGKQISSPTLEKGGKGGF